MSERAKELIDEHLKGLQATGTTGTAAEYIVHTILTDLEADGISADEASAAVGGNLKAYVKSALSAAGGDA